MSRNYGSLGRRSGGAGWQWMIIGLVLGFACSAVLVFFGVIAGVVNISGAAIAGLPTQTPMIITATPPPASPTPQPTEVIVTPTSAGVQVEALPPTATPTTEPTLLTIAPTATPTTFPTPGLQVQNAGQQTSAVDLVLLDRIQPSELLPVPGATQFQMGTTIAEVSTSVDECVALGARCTLAMGEDSYPQHPVDLSPFQIERTEVTYGQYLAFMNYLEETRGPRSHLNGCNGFLCLKTNLESATSAVTYDSVSYTALEVINNLPITEVTWYGAQAFCQAIGRRLPTEAEWEYAARGTDGRVYPWGSTWDPALAATNRTADGSAGAKVDVNTFPLGQSFFGALNMAGNVSEWVSDWYDPRFYGRPEASLTDPVGPASGTTRVIRGGSWDNPPFFARSVHRQDFAPNDGTPFIGFRCAADPETTTPGNASAQGGGVLPGIVPSPDPSLLGVQPTQGPIDAAPTLPPIVIPTATPPVAGQPGG